MISILKKIQKQAGIVAEFDLITVTAACVCRCFDAVFLFCQVQQEEKMSQAEKMKVSFRKQKSDITCEPVQDAVVPDSCFFF